MSDEPSLLKPIADTVQRLEEILAFLPDAVARDLRGKIGTLRGILLEQRPPAVVLVGRRGAGKSSLINALFGEQVAEVGHVKAQTGKGRWFDFKSPEGAVLSILDTRGMQEGGAPAEADASKSALHSIVLELKKKAPDVILFVVKASEADAAIDSDVRALEEVLGEIEREHHVRPPVLAVATHCDLLEPKDARLDQPDGAPPAELEEKLVHVATVERLLEKKLRERGPIAPHLTRTLGVSAYQSWRKDGTRRSDHRWRIDRLAHLLFQHLPDAGRGMFVRVARIKALQDELALTLTRATAAVCAGLAALPIPVADVLPITALQVSLIAGIAWISGRSLEGRAAAEFLTGLGVNVGAAFGLRQAARALVKFVFPGAGAAVSSIVAFGGTMAIGAAARLYFIRGSDLPEARRAYESARAGGDDPGEEDAPP